MTTVTITLRNETSDVYALNHQSMLHGEWTQPPPESIGANSVTTIIAASDGAGVQGSAYYGNRDNLSFTFNFDNPVIGSNSYSASATPTPQYECTSNGGGGTNSSVTYVVELSPN